MDSRSQELESGRNRDSLDILDRLDKNFDHKTNVKVKGHIIKEKAKKSKYTTVKEKSNCHKKD